MYTNHRSKAAAVREAHHLRKRYAAQSVAWLRLCDAYLPRIDSSTIWRYSAANPAGLAQGWKLHIPATIFTAVKVLERVGPLLDKRGVLFKAPASLDELAKLNAGIFYGYSQVGKCLTIYPPSDSEARKLARTLHRLTRDCVAPSIPYDLRYRPESSVYYRYGSFIEQTVEKDGQIKLAIEDPTGELIPDRRDVASPSWAEDPFINKKESGRHQKPVTLLTTRFKAFRALAQRGKGGVYQALDFGSMPPRMCVLKEGRRHGEVGIDGRDGFWRVQHEERLLKTMTSNGLRVQSVYASFIAEKNFYLALEYIEGETLEAYLESRRRRLTIASVLRKSIALADLLAEMHRLGWVWRDCKPRNLIVTKKGTLRAIDFEGACPIVTPDPFPWGTYPFSPADSEAPFCGQNRLPEDLYSLGKIMFLLLAGRLPEVDSQPIGDLRKGVPAGVCEIVSGLLHHDPERRPQAKIVKERLIEEMKRLKPSSKKNSGSAGKIL